MKSCRVPRRVKDFSPFARSNGKPLTRYKQRANRVGVEFQKDYSGDKEKAAEGL